MGAKRLYTPRLNAGGNFCGHDPRQPHLTLPFALPTNLPAVLAHASARFAARHYRRPRYWFPSLNLVNGSTRQQRSERREAIGLVMGVILAYTELSSLRFGIPTVNGFIVPDLKWLASKAGINLTRTKRAIADLTHSGLLSAQQPRTMNDLGQYRGHPVVRGVNTALFAILGLAKQLERARKAAAKRIRHLARQVTARAPVPASVLKLKLFLDGAGSNQRPAQPLPYRRGREPPDKERRRAQAGLLSELSQVHPDWTYEQVIAELRRRSP